ncbi:MAG: glycosyltransferase [Luteibacter sp.]|uniref:glycosyltransferase n=1 Tax=Luteibacter sp. TaxID=1886636 RepID=UPI0028075C05|nr:glycosyltransferase [Luteibacter sp.]MDQ7997149.1 glycosyltransferase [Luteibacter sp.]
MTQGLATEAASTGTKATVLVLASTYPRWKDDHEPGFVHELCRRLTQRFHVIAVVPDAPDADPSGFLDGVEVVRYRYAPRRLQTLVNDGGIAANLRRSVWKWVLVPGFVLMQYVSARRLLSRRNVAVIHAHWLISPGVVARLLCSPGVPYIVTSHGGDLFGFRGSMFASIKRWVASRAAAMSVVSAAMSEEAHHLALPVARIETIPMGVDVARFGADETVARSTSELLFVGRLVPKKGLNYLLDAMPAIIERRPDVTLRIVGFGPESDALRRQAIQLGLAHKVVFAGAVAQTELPRFYGSAALFVAPFVRDVSGDQEGLPIALMEAVSMGCSFVVGDVAGLDDLLGDAAAAYRVDARDPVALASAVLGAMADPEAAKAAATAAAKVARDYVDWTIIARRYADLLASCMHGARI